MEQDQEQSSGFLKTFLLPLLYVFIVPVISYAFFAYATSDYDSQLKSVWTQSAQADRSISANELKAELEMIEAFSVSDALLGDDPTSQELRKSFPSELSTDYYFFDLGLTLSIICIGGVIFGIVSVLSIIGLTMKKQDSLYLGYKFSFILLKIICAIEVICQSALLVGLSYYITVVLWSSYFPKIIVVIAIFALIGIWGLIMAIFTRVDTTIHLEGEKINKDDSPEFWNCLKDICAKFEIKTPDNLILGIDDNFFVTENAIIINEKELEGKTLYVGIPFLKLLDKKEVTAILAHEMAHFSGNDTTHTKKLWPLLQKNDYYLESLSEGIALPVFYFMLFFWSLYHIVINKVSREREFRADTLAAEYTDPSSIAHSLLKTSAYSSLRASIMNDLFSQDEQLADIDLSNKILNNYKEYVNSDKLSSDLDLMNVTHPFDTHPSLKQRFENIDISIEPSEFKNIILKESIDNFFSEIRNADKIAKKLWKEFEDNFRKAHNEDLAYRLDPKTFEEKAIVYEFFPDTQIPTKKNDKFFDITYQKFSFDTWEDEVHFKDIVKVELDDGGVNLSIWFTPQGGKKKKVVLKLKFFADKNAMVELFEKYYGRHQAMIYYQENSDSSKGENK